VADLLRDLCAAIDAPIQRRGRPRIPLADAVFAAVMKVYGTTSGRRAMSDMREFQAKGLIDRAPSYNSIFQYLENPILTPLLKAMVEESARPLKAVESEFAVDSTGFSSSVHRRWFDAKYGKMQRMTEYVKAHAMVGVRTNVVTSVEVTPGNVNDYPLLPALLKATTATFNVTKLSADKGYSGRSNVAAIVEAGALPLIAFKVNAKAGAPGPWRQSFEFFQEHQEEFYRQYHKRSNVETTFSMIKAKFGGFVRSKTPVAQMNEVLCKVLAHNLCVLVHAFFELGIEPQFWQVPMQVPMFELPKFPPRTPWMYGRGKGPAQLAEDTPY
jgi:transposase